MGRKTNIAYNSTTGPGNAYSYDALGRVTSASTYSWPITFQYDLAGDRTAITWWDGVAATYAYDTDGEMTSIAPSATGAPVSTLASYSYDDLGRRTGVSRGNGVSTSYSYDGISRLTNLTHTMAGGNVQSQAYGLGYTEASQINTLSQSNGAYLWAASSGAPSFDGEFNALSLWNGSTGVWATNYGFGGNPDSVAARTLPGTGEVELYVDPSMTGTGTTALGLNPYSLSGGVLDIHGAPTPAADLSSIWGYNFTSGMISTRNSFTQTYGYFEAGMKLPSGTGNWPAFWLYAVNANSELDVMEEQNGSNTITGTAHNNGAGGAATGVTNSIPNLTAGFHKFGVLWTPTTITWYVDEVSIGSVPTPSNLNSPMYMIANLALNSSTPSTYAGGDLQIEYVRAYTLENAPVFTSNQNVSYSVNGLNQVTASGAAAISYDARGNLTSDGVNTYAYDTLNQLSTFNTSTTLSYDARHRLTSISANGATATQFVYAGDQLAAEVQVTGSTPTIVGRYVPSLDEDRPLTMYTGATMASPYELLEDHAGSIVAANSAAGGSLYVNTYSDYGVQGASNFGRYQYTGQVWLPEVGLYNYKGRLYSGTLGRFMQTDPSGYGDGPNWYAYVHGDPVNGTDPSGLDDCSPNGDGTYTCTGATVNGAGSGGASGGGGGGAAPEPGSGRGVNVVQEVVVTAHRFRPQNNGCPAGTVFVPDAQPAAAAAAVEAGSPTVPTRGKLGMEPSGNFTSPASAALRPMTGNTRFGPLRIVTGTSSVGGSLGRTLPFLGVVLVILDALVDAQQQTQPPSGGAGAPVA